MSPSRTVVLLDLDGCLTDSAPGILACVRHALAGLGAPDPGDAVLRRFLGPPLHESFARIGVDPEPAVTLYRERYREVGITELEVYDGIADLLAGLRSDGSRLCLATSKPEVFARRILASTGLSLDETVGSELDGSRSRKADVIDEALRRLDAAPPDAVMVGDRAEDCVGAAACGVAFVGAGWGYGRPGELFDAGATQVAASPRHLLQLLRSGSPAAG